MRGVAVFRGGPLDEEVRELPDLTPDYRVPFLDRSGPLWAARNSLSESPTTAPSFTVLIYRRTRRCPGNNGCPVNGGEPHAIYEFLL